MSINKQVQSAIAESVRMHGITAFVICKPETKKWEAIYGELFCLCDDDCSDEVSARLEETNEFWGTDRDGNSWRVQLISA